MSTSGKQRPSTPRGKRSLTSKGARTRQALLAAARQVFEDGGYFGASVSEIGRRCGVSQGTFYQYFKNKDQVFRELVDAVLAQYWSKAAAGEAGGNPGREQLGGVLALLLEHCREHAGLHRVLNEFELIESVTISYFDSLARHLRGFFRRAAQDGWLKPLDPNLIAYSLIGLATFLQRDWGGVARQWDPAELTALTSDLLLRGISGDAPWSGPEPAGTAPAPEPDAALHWDDGQAQGKRTKLALFQAAEQVFGELGYSRAGIAEITRRAGVAQGTFYVHFKSKDELMNGVVRFLSHELRRELRRVTDRAVDRRDKEVQGMTAFFSFLGRHSLIYRIVSESEAIVPESAEYYYRKLAAGYTGSLAAAMDAGQVRRLPVDFLAPSLMGIHHMIGLRWLVWSSATHPAIPKQILNDAVELVLFGLADRG